LESNYGFDRMPSRFVVQIRVDRLQEAFPNKDRIELHDALKSSNGSILEAIEKLTIVQTQAVEDELEQTKKKDKFMIEAKWTPRPDIVQTRVDFLQKVFPWQLRMDLHDVLKSSDWSMHEAIQKFANWRHCLKEIVETSDSEADSEADEIVDSESDLKIVETKSLDELEAAKNALKEKDKVIETNKEISQKLRVLGRDLNNRNEGMLNEVAKLKEELKAAKNALEEKDKAIETYKEQSQKLRVFGRNLKTNNEGMLKEVAKQKEELKAAKNALQEKDKAIETYKEQSQKLRDFWRNLKNNNEGILKEVAMLKEELKAAKNALKEKDKAIETNKEQSLKLRVFGRNLRNNNEGMLKKVAKQKEELKAAKNALKEKDKAIETNEEISQILGRNFKNKNEDLNETLNETKKTLDKKKAEIDALKTELKITRSSLAEKTSITVITVQEREAEIALLNAKNDQLSHELTNAKATIVFEDNETKECKCSVKEILNADLQNRVDRMTGILDLRDNEIKLKDYEIKLKVEEIRLLTT
jgi:myosin heavy subunit